MSFVKQRVSVCLTLHVQSWCCTAETLNYTFCIVILPLEEEQTEFKKTRLLVQLNTEQNLNSLQSVQEV